MRLFWPTAFFSASFCAASDIFASWWLLLHKAAVTGTALTCHCVRPTTTLTAGHPQAAAVVLHRETRRWWRVSHQRRQTCNTISVNMGHHPWRKYDAWTDLFWHFICLKYRNCTRKCNNEIKNVPNFSIFSVVESTVPSQRIRCFANNKPWVTPDLKALLREKNRAFSSGGREELKRVQRELKCTIRRCRENYRRNCNLQFSSTVRTHFFIGRHLKFLNCILIASVFESQKLKDVVATLFNISLWTYWNLMFSLTTGSQLQFF